MMRTQMNELKNIRTRTFNQTSTFNQTRTLKQASAFKQKGAMLIEVLVSILIFSFGLLGLVGLQAVASQNSVNAQDRSVAANIANEMVTEMWLRNTSNPANLAAPIAAWQARIASCNLPGSRTNCNLPGAVGTAVMNGAITTVQITWRPTSRRAAENASKYETQVVVDQ